MKRLVQKIPYWIIDIISLISGLVTIITGIYGVVSIKKLVKELPDGNYEVNINPWLVSIIIMLLFFLGVIFFQMRKYGSLLHASRKIVSKNYYGFLHDFRNQYFEMIKEHKTNKDTNKKHKIGILTSNTKKYLVKSLDYVCEIISSSARADVSACIKVIDNEGEDGTPIDINHAKVRTFCRSSNTDGERISHDMINNVAKSVKIIDNTDFYDILKGDSGSGFYQRNLLDYSKKLEEAGKIYRNTTEQYWRYYKGTIVAPIRVAKERLHYVDSDDDFDVIGFLCIDTLSTNVFREKDKSYYMKIVKSFAAELYIILNKYNYYLTKIEGEK